MAMNRVQFQPGLSMAEFTGLYGTQELCEAAVRSWRWPEGFVCPGCGTTDHSEFRRGSLLYFQCCSCRHQCSLICGTIFASTKLPLTRWFLAMHLLTQAKNNVAALELMRHLGVSYPTAWLIKHKIMEVMRQREERRYLTGRVEIDDAYLGGELPGGKPGRGSENKVSFVAAVQTTESGAPVFACFSQRPFTKESLLDFAAKSLAAPPHSSPTAWGASRPCRAPASFTNLTLRAAARIPSSVRSSQRSTPFLATSRRRWPVPTTRSTSPSTLIDISPRCSTASTVASTCEASWAGSPAPRATPAHARCVWLNALSILDNQVERSNGSSIYLWAESIAAHAAARIWQSTNDATNRLASTCGKWPTAGN